MCNRFLIKRLTDNAMLEQNLRGNKLDEAKSKEGLFKSCHLRTCISSALKILSEKCLDLNVDTDEVPDVHLHCLSEWNNRDKRLEGLDKGINDNPENISRYGGRLGRSWGCPSLPPKIAKEIIDKIKNGSIIYIFAE